MRIVRLYVVVSDPRTGDGGGRWLAATPNETDAKDLAEMLGGIVSDEMAEATERDARPGLQFIGTSGCPIYMRAWNYAETQISPSVLAFVKRTIERAIEAAKRS